MRSNFPVTGIEYPVREDQSLISRTDRSGNITYVNHDFIEMSGFAENELIGQPHNIIRHPDMPVEAFADLWSTLKAGKSWTGMVKNRRKNGDHYWVLANATPIRENGQIIGYTSVRTAPTRAQIDAATRAYARFKDGTADGLRIAHGKVVRKGVLGHLAGLADLHIRGKLIAVVLLLCLFMSAVGLLGLAGMAASNQRLESVYANRAVPIGLLDRVAGMLGMNRLNISAALLSPNPASAQAAVGEIEHNIVEINKALEALKATRFTPEEARLAEDFIAARTVFVRDGLLPAVAALKAGDWDEARRIELEVMPAAYKNVRQSINALIQLQLDIAKAESAEASENYALTRNLAVAMICAGVALSIFLVLYAIRTIVRPLGLAVDVAKQIAAGNLTARIQANSGDEIGQLLHSLNVMQKCLANIITGVRDNADLIQGSAQEIVSGNQDLSQRTEAQASSLQQTAASMEELSSTVKHNADNSRNAKLLADEACDIAIRGGAAMSQVVGTMESISSSSKKITDIIAVIDGIAFQTNILALNAAVEAARAGEQGRGFAVVAAEVRNLAQRSAAAAREIKHLIDDSVGKVDNGTSQVAQAQATIDGIVDAVRKVTDIMNEITSSTVEQSSGIEQVSQAVAQMDQGTQKNASLVEESATVAGSLQERASSLLQGIGVFKLG